MDYEVGESLLSGLVGLLRPAKEDIIQKPDLLDGNHIGLILLLSCNISSGCAPFAKIETILSDWSTFYILEILTCDPFICTMNHPRLIEAIKMEEIIGIERVNWGKKY